MWSRIVDVAVRYRVGLTPLQNGHYTVYHDDLAAAARGLGHDVLILCGSSGNAADGVDACLPEDDVTALAQELTARIRPGDLVMVYEGSVALLEAMVPLADAAADAMFVVNLFRPESGIDALGAVSQVGGEALRSLGSALPPNLRPTADTPERVVLARRAGLPVRAAWSLHSIVATVPPSERVRHEVAPLRVLVPLRPGGFDPGPIGDVAYAARRLSREAGDVVRLSVTRPAEPAFKARVRGDRLARLGVELIQPSSERASYAAMFAAHDVVWIAGGYDFTNGYVTQSSGKTLDALAAGVPVLGAAGTTVAREPLRWSELPLGVDGRDEAVDALLALVVQATSLGAHLRAQQDAIRAAYAPEMTIRRVLEVAELADDAWADPLLDRPADLSRSAGHRVPVDSSDRRVPRPPLERIRAHLEVRRAIHIPVSQRVWWSARGRLGRLKTAFLSWRRPARPSSL